MKKDLFAGFKTRSFRMGGYSVAATALVLAILIVVNVLMGVLPSKWTQLDLSSNQLFTISQQTEEVLASLDEQVDIYWIAQSGAEDDTLGALLDKYAGMSSKLSVSKKDPNVNPTFVQKYVTSGLYNNSLIVECGERFRYVPYDEIFEYDYSNYYYDGSYSVSFAGEGALTSAIAYVTSETLPKVYLLSGHGEPALSNAFSTAAEKQNMELVELSLLSAGEIPADASAIIIHSPQSDISAEEKTLLSDWMAQGGKLFYISNPADSDGQFANIEAVLADYGTSAVDGVVLEGNQNNYSIMGPLYLIPTIKSHAITAPLIENNYFILAPIAHGIAISENLGENLTVEALLSTSSSAYSKLAGYEMSTYKKEEGDIDGPLNLAVAAEDSTSGAQIVWLSSAYLVDDSANAQVSGANQDFFLNCLAWMCELEDGISIHSKSLDAEYLTINDGTASLLSLLVVGIIPVAYLCVGIVTTVKRRRS